LSPDKRTSIADVNIEITLGSNDTGRQAYQQQNQTNKSMNMMD